MHFLVDKVGLSSYNMDKVRSVSAGRTKKRCEIFSKWKSLFVYKKQVSEVAKWEQVKDKLEAVEGWARAGLNDIQIAKNLGIRKEYILSIQKKA